MIPEVINTVKSDFGWDEEYDLDYGEYTLEEAFFNQLEEERLEKKREKRKKKKRKNLGNHTTRFCLVSILVFFSFDFNFFDWFDQISVSLFI